MEPITVEIILRAMAANKGTIFFLWTLNPREMDKTLLSRLEQLQKDKRALEFSLKPFTDVEIQNYLEDFLGVTNVEKEIIEHLQKMTGGNPYFLQELLKAWIGKGILVDRKNQQLQWKEIATTPVLEELLEQTLNRIKGDEKTIFEILLVHGRRLSSDVLQSISQLEKEKLFGALENLIAQQAVHKSGSNVFEIANTLLREIGYKKITKLKKKKIHELLLEFFETQDSPIENLAYHASFANEDPKRSQYLIDAAQKTESRFQYDQALSWYQKLIIRKTPILELQEIQLRIAKLQTSLGHFSEAQKGYNAILVQSGSKEDLHKGMALRGLGWLSQREGEHDQALTFFQKSHSILEKENSDYQIVVLNDIGHHYLSKREWSKAADAFERSAKELEKSPNLEYAKNNHLAIAYQEMGQTTEAMQFAQKKSQWAISQKNQPIIALSYSEIGQLYLEMGNYPESQQYYEMALEILEQIHSPNAIKVLNDLLSIAQIESCYGDAINYLEKLLEQTQVTTTPKMMAHYYLIAGNLYSTIGLFNKSQQYLEEAMKLYDQLQNEHQAGWVYLMLGYLENGLTQWKTAEKWFQQALLTGQKHKDPLLETHSLLGLCDTYYWDTKIPEAEKQLGLAKDKLKQLQDPELHYRIDFFEILIHLDKPLDLKPLLKEDNLEHRFEIRDLFTRHFIHQQDFIEAKKWYIEGLDILSVLIHGLPEAHQESFRLQPRIQRFIKLMGKPKENEFGQAAPLEAQPDETKVTEKTLSDKTKPIQKASSDTKPLK